jgi:hypothetical protein
MLLVDVQPLLGLAHALFGQLAFRDIISLPPLNSYPCASLVQARSPRRLDPLQTAILCRQHALLVFRMDPADEFASQFGDGTAGQVLCSRIREDETQIHVVGQNHFSHVLRLTRASPFAGDDILPQFYNVKVGFPSEVGTCPCPATPAA